MEFASAPETFCAKVMGVSFSTLIKSRFRKALQKDLQDIKAAAVARV